MAKTRKATSKKQAAKKKAVKRSKVKPARRGVKQAKKGARKKPAKVSARATKAAKRPLKKATASRPKPKAAAKPRQAGKKTVATRKPAAAAPAPRHRAKQVVVKPSPVAVAAPAPAGKPAGKQGQPAVARIVARPVARPASKDQAPVAVDPRSFPALREKLEKKRQDMLAMYERDLRSGQEASDENTDDIVDRANNAYSRELMFALSDSERKLLFQVEGALKRMDEGSYGRCVHCAQQISAPRLEAVPWARHCIDCQELQEKGLLED